MKYEVLFYWNERGDVPVREFLRGLPEKTRQKIGAWISLLEEHGPFLRRPYAEKVSGKLYELRIGIGSDHVRILYFFFLKNKIILLHAFRKKEWEIRRGDIETATRRSDDFIRRYEQGNIQLA